MEWQRVGSLQQLGLRRHLSPVSFMHTAVFYGSIYTSDFTFYHLTDCFHQTFDSREKTDKDTMTTRREWVWFNVYSALTSESKSGSPFYLFAAFFFWWRCTHSVVLASVGCAVKANAHACCRGGVGLLNEHTLAVGVGAPWEWFRCKEWAVVCGGDLWPEDKRGSISMVGTMLSP